MHKLTDRDYVERLEGDIENLKWRLEKLKEDHAAWQRSLQEDDLQSIKASLIQMDYDLDLMFTNCFALLARDHDSVTQAYVHHLYDILNCLFEDVKRARDNLEQAFIAKHDLEQMEIDCGRLEKTTGKIMGRLDVPPLEAEWQADYKIDRDPTADEAC